ncbi:MAG: (2Fe-2S)-binding protein [Caulobacteraceae bacterium]|nr:(2Fe-2S)-binding protein [Caulobacter sp.]
MTEDVTITFDGRAIPARVGESLAAALTAAGVTTFRTTRSDQPRGLFCGMGVCQDCLVEVDGRPNQRACMIKVAGPMTVVSEAHLRPLPPVRPSLAPAETGGMRVERPEVLVIGAGPGGLSAAIAARQAGASVVLLDERSQPGGQYFKQVSVSGVAPPDAQHRAGAALVAEARRLGVEIRSDILVWGAFAPREFVASGAGLTTRFEPQVAIVATGAYERGWPVPGWTLPGVMTTGAAQTLWRTARRLPGRRVLIAGNGPLNLQLGAELLEGGAEVVAVAEASRRPAPRDWRTLLAMTRAAPGLIVEGLRYHTARRRGGAAMLHGMVVSHVEAKPDGGLAVVLSPGEGPGGARRFEVDALCLGYGFEPSNEVLRALGCAHDYDPVRRHLVTRRDADGRTDMPGIFALGDCTGLGGAKAALAEGTLAGLAAAQDLGHAAGSPASLQAVRAALDRHRTFQRALWSLYAAPPFNPALTTPETMICRCEEVTFAAIEEALAEGMTGIGAVKRRTRVGMGRCQGRYCAPALDQLLADRFGRPRDAFSAFAPRVPVKPVAIEDVARLAP